MSHKVGYVVVREDLYSPVVQTQVIDVLESMSSLTAHKLFLIWFYRIDYLWSSESKRMTQEAAKRMAWHDIKVVAIPFIGGRFPVAWWFLPVLLMQLLLGLAWAKLRFGIQLFHCRSYHAGLAGAVFTMISSCRMVFDPRSPFLEEHVASGRWCRGSLSYLVWARLEKLIVSRSSVVIATTHAFAKDLRAVDPSIVISVIPNNVSWMARSKPELTTHDTQQPVVICYVGSMGHWNKSSVYVEFLQQLALAGLNECEMLFVVPKRSVAKLEKVIQESKIDNTCISIQSVSREQVPEALMRCTVGLQLMDHRDVRLGIKVVEYLAAGLPVIVSENVIGAAEVIQSLGVGFVLDADRKKLSKALSFVRDVQLNRGRWREHCQKTARDNFSTPIIAKQILHLYGMIMSGCQQGNAYDQE